ncbi:LRR RECEPTOR-LIKE KINASE FAMILY PROTEIN [Salix purpurea]|uniref:non-specific serine/threonine protein kinase n=1 Tax=Salix purpurea TaxID=77065 RepID=A0A9Q1A3M4_SALPP|nr:LRR RECEPTOR-LIKE KINASE FAMILY PROTEIN [Salix purpurea]
MTAKCDVFSFGVLALEAVMGKHPDELVSTLQSSTDQQEIETKNVLDQRLPPPSCQRIEKEVVSVVMLAFSCLKVNPDFRPSMHDVTNVLSNPQSQFLLAIEGVAEVFFDQAHLEKQILLSLDMSYLSCIN